MVSVQGRYLGRALRAAGLRTLAALVFGDNTCAVAAGLVRDAARVDRTVAVGAEGFRAIVLVRFLGTGRSVFSLSSPALSSPDISSLLRFLARVFFVALAYAGVGLVALAAGLTRSSKEDAGLEEEPVAALVGAAVRALRVAVAVAFLVGAGFAGGAATTTGGAGAETLRSWRSVVWRVTTGMRLTRRSRRDCILAHCASHWARNFSVRESISICRFVSMLALASAVIPSARLFIIALL